MADPKTRKSVLITGAGKRIGRAIALLLAADGWFVWIHHNRSVADARGTLDDIAAAGGAGKLVKADLAAPQGVDRLFEKIDASGPPLTALVNNAAVFDYDSPQTVTGDNLDSHYRVNVRAPALLMRAFHDRILESATGCVVSILDSKVFAPNPDYFSYTVTKYALLSMTKTAAMAFAPRVRVCAVAPAITLLSGGQSEENFERSRRINLLKAAIEPEDIARAVQFLLDNDKLTGTTLVVDAGQSLQRLPRDVAFLVAEGQPPTE